GFGDGFDGAYFPSGSQCGSPIYVMDETHVLADPGPSTSGDGVLAFMSAPDAYESGWYYNRTGGDTLNPVGTYAPGPLSGGSAGTVTAITSDSTNTVTLTIAGKIYTGDTITVEYDSATGNVTD